MKLFDSTGIFYEDNLPSLYDTLRSVIDQKIELSGLVLDGEVFENQDFSGLTISEATFNNVKFINCTFKNCYISNSRITNCCFDGSTFESVNIFNTDMSESTFVGAIMTNVAFRDSDINMCNFNNIVAKELDLRYVKNRETASFDNINLTIRGETTHRMPFYIYGFAWPVVITNDHVMFGCQKLTHDQVRTMTKEQIEQVHESAYAFWEKHKDEILKAMDSYTTV